MSTFSPYNYFANILAEGKLEEMVCLLGKGTGTLKYPWPDDFSVTDFLCPPVFSIYKTAIIFNELIRVL